MIDSQQTLFQRVGGRLPSNEYDVESAIRG